MSTTTYQIDPAHSSLQFSVRHLMLAHVRGTFSGVTGTVTLDRANPGQTTIEASIDVNTVKTSDEKRDEHLKTPDFFDIANHPHITFRSTKVEPKSETEFSVTGDLTLHGVTKPVTLQVDEVTPDGKDPWGNMRFGASAKGKIKRSDFGLTYNAVLEAGGVAIGDEVKLDFELELARVQSAAA